MPGLTTAEATSRLSKYGFNELPSGKSKTISRIAIEVMQEPMFLLLIACSVLYLLLGDYREGIILLLSIFLIIGITFYQHRKTERALEALKNLSSPRALVIRDGIEKRIAGREVVPGDVLILNEGDRISADGSLIEVQNLTVDESILTGESVAVLKKTGKENSDVFSGTLAVKGMGLALVTQTGLKSRLGFIAESLKTIKDDRTRLQAEMKTFIKKLSIIGITISIAVVVVFYLRRGNFIQSLLTGLSSAMAILPEEFPVVLTVFLALGAWRLSRKNVLTRKPSAIETLGSATVLCSDKTGTITQNKMEVAALYDGRQIIEKDTFLTSKELVSELVIAAHRASTHNSIDPMEKAIHETHAAMASQGIAPLKLVKEYPISQEMLVMTRVLEAETEGENGYSVSAKGAPEMILELCKLTPGEISRHTEALHAMAGKGLRVLGVAKAKHTGNVLPEKQYEYSFEFAGLVGLEDPVREEVPQAVKECREAGIKVIMITGDFPVTAKSIGEQIGLSTENIISGSELTLMSDKELAEKIKDVSVFARIIPEQKLRIVEALKANGEIVAMTGDGVNDAPALKAAHIGIAMGNKGTDVAREAASLVLLDDNFSSIVSAIRLGRRIFDNLQKAMSYILAIHIPIIGLALLPALFTSLPVLLLPLHIVFMELIIDPVSSVAFEYERDEKDIMRRPPRNPAKKFFGGNKIAFSLFQGVMLLAMVIGVYLLSLNEGHTEKEVRAIAFSSLIIGNILLVLTNLSKSRSVVAVVAERNLPAIFILTSALGLLVLINIVPALQNIFSLNFPGYKHFVISVSGAMLVLFILEIIKYFRVKNTSR